MKTPLMPGVYPKRTPDDIPTSEAIVLGMIIEAIPAGWSAWHSLKIRTSGGEFGEADFLIAAPDKGLVIFEVKGGLIEKKEGAWFQNGKPIKPPLQQAHHFRKLLLDMFDRARLNAPPIGAAVVFPDMYAAEGPSQGDLADVVIQGRELQYLKEIFPEMFRTALPKSIPYSPSPGWPQFIHDLWCECWPLEMNLSRRVKEDLKSRLPLDDDQMTVRESLPENRRALVKGPAGTGKTLLALSLAVSQAESGRSVLLLTYTEALAFELSRRTEGSPVTVSSVGRLALEYLRRQGFKEKESYTPEFWNKVMKKAAASKLFDKPDKWDLVIIDEGQDMDAEEWRFINKGLREDSRLWVFADPGQAFWPDNALPTGFMEDTAVFNLPRPYRCPPGIQALADAYLGKDMDSAAVKTALADRTIEMVAAPDGELVHTAVGHEIKRLLAAGFAPAEVAVISLRGIQFENNIAHCRSLGDQRTVVATDPGAEEAVVCDSFLRFKGLERPAVIVTDLDHAPGKFGVRMNIAVTRATGVLRIVGEAGQIADDDVLSRYRPA